MSFDPFEVHGIEHLSPSSCSLYIGSPAMFVLEKLLKHKQPVGAAAHRGTAVEEGIVHGLMHPDALVVESAQIAKRKFDTLTAFSGDPKKEKEAGAIVDMVKTGIAELLGYGKPSSTQGKIEWKVEGLSVPLIGYYDLEWEDHGILLDIKTTHALPNKIKANHARQVALYMAARGNNTDARISYITPKKSATYQLENVSDHVEALRKVALTIQRFLSLSKDPMELAALVVPDTDSFYFNDPLARQKAFEVWGI